MLSEFSAQRGVGEPKKYWGANSCFGKFLKHLKNTPMRVLSQVVDDYYTIL
jgi:hypothetical protein